MPFLAPLLIAHLAARPAVRHAVPNLRQEASVQTLDEPIAVHGSGRIVVDGASSLRLRIRTTPGAVLHIGGERFDVESGEEWGPTTNGDAVDIDSSAPLLITQIAAGDATLASAASPCLEETACSTAADSPEVRDASRAVAMIRFVRGDASYVCSGALLADAAHSGTPYFLTARHCIGTAEEAASIEAVWDARSESCGVSGANVSGTRTYGAELLVASAETDVALLRLRKLPPNRVFLGVELAPLAEGTIAYRLSHAAGAPQTFSSGVVRMGGGECPAAPRPRFLYTSTLEGAVTAGSSGAPLLLPGLRAAGQLLGVCGRAPDDSCARDNDAVDGSIAASWPLLAPFLDPSAGPRRRAVR